MSNKGIGTDKDLEKLARRARRAGWTVEVTGRNHVRWTAPDGRQSFTTGLTMNRRSTTVARRRIERLLDHTG